MGYRQKRVGFGPQSVYKDTNSRVTLGAHLGKAYRYRTP